MRRIGSRVLLVAGTLLAAAGAASGQVVAEQGAAGAAPSEAPAFIDMRTGHPFGRPVVLIPGLASSGDVWADAAAALPEHDVHALTLAGFAGVPPRGDGAPVIEGAARAVAEMLEAQDLRDAVLVGHSLGGQVAVQAALLAPDRVSQLVIVDSAPFYAGLTQPGASVEQAEAFADAVAAQMAGLTREAFDAQQAAGLQRYSKDPDFIETLTAWSDASDMETVIRGFAEVAGGDFREDIAAVAAETLVLVAYDPAMGVRRDLYEALWRDQYAQAAEAELIVVDGAYHFLMHDQREAFLAALTDFLDGDDR